MRKETNIENWYWEVGSLSVMNLIMWFFSLWNGLPGGMWKNLEPWGREALECSKSLMGHSGRSLEKQNTIEKNYRQCKLGLWSFSWSLLWVEWEFIYNSILPVSLDEFCLCPGTLKWVCLSEAELKRSCAMEDVSRAHDIHAEAWLLFLTRLTESRMK